MSEIYNRVKALKPRFPIRLLIPKKRFIGSVLCLLMLSVSVYLFIKEYFNQELFVFNNLPPIITGALTYIGFTLTFIVGFINYLSYQSYKKMIGKRADTGAVVIVLFLFFSHLLLIYGALIIVSDVFRGIYSFVCSIYVSKNLNKDCLTAKRNGIPTTFPVDSALVVVKYNWLSKRAYGCWQYLLMDITTIRKTTEKEKKYLEL